MDDIIDIVEMNVKWSNFEYMIGDSIVFNFEGSDEEYNKVLKKVRRLGRAKIRFTVYAEPTLLRGHTP